MTIRASDVLPDPDPIWDQGLMVRPLTLDETRALLDEFRTVRADYGRIVYEYRKLSEDCRASTRLMRADYRKKIYTLLKALVRFTSARSKKGKVDAKKAALETLEKFGIASDCTIHNLEDMEDEGIL